MDFTEKTGERLKYEIEYVALVENTYVTLNRGDIIAGVALDPQSVIIFRLRNNVR